jgi:hypothetical protein
MRQIIKRRLESRHLFRDKKRDGSSGGTIASKVLQLSRLPNHDWAGLHGGLRI